MQLETGTADRVYTDGAGAGFICERDQRAEEPVECGIYHSELLYWTYIHYDIELSIDRIRDLRYDGYASAHY